MTRLIRQRPTLLCNGHLVLFDQPRLALFLLGIATIANPCWAIGYLTFGHICAWALPYFGFIAWPAVYFVYACVDGGFAATNAVFAALGGCWASLCLLELPIVLLNVVLAYLITKVDPRFSARATCTRIFACLRSCVGASPQQAVTNTQQAVKQATTEQVVMQVRGL
jgi:hypothetical protein